MTNEPTRSKPTFAHIADTLGETERQPRGQLRAIVDALGDEAALSLLAEVQRIEADGGILLPDGSRRRTPGGVFFHLAYEQLAPEQRQAIYRRGRRADADSGDPTAPPATWADRGAWIAEARPTTEEATTVKITLIGKLGKTIEKPNFTLAMLTHTPRLDTLPKGIPRPEAKATSYVVYIGGKQWRKVKDALRNPEDAAIIEGTPMWDAEYQALAVFAQSVTTKLTQQAKREEQRAKAQQG
jgi:hypothetical protein